MKTSNIVTALIISLRKLSKNCQNLVAVSTRNFQGSSGLDMQLLVPPIPNLTNI